MAEFIWVSKKISFFSESYSCSGFVHDSSSGLLRYLHLAGLTALLSGVHLRAQCVWSEERALTLCLPTGQARGRPRLHATKRWEIQCGFLNIFIMHLKSKGDSGMHGLRKTEGLFREATQLSNCSCFKNSGCSGLCVGYNSKGRKLRARCVTPTQGFPESPGTLTLRLSLTSGLAAGS